MNVIYINVAKMSSLLLPPPVKIFFCEVFKSGNFPISFVSCRLTFDNSALKDFLTWYL
jgi:hypothetical protein